MKTAAMALASLLSVAALAQAAEPPRAANEPAAESVKPAKDAPAPKPEAPDAAKSRADASSKARQDASHRFEPPRGRTCFNSAETREKIATHRLTEPFRALRAGRLQGEALRAKLCRWKPDEFVYEVSVLRPNGRVAHIYMNAQNGQSVGALNDTDRN